MADSEEGIEATEELVLRYGNQILKIVGADEEITEIDPFCTDALYLQLFKALFPQLPLDDMQPGESEEEVTDNLTTLISQLGQYVLETDLSYINSTNIIHGDLTHLSEFLQILLQVVALLAEEGEDEDEEVTDVSKELDQEQDRDQQREDHKMQAQEDPNEAEFGLNFDDKDEEMKFEKDDFQDLNQYDIDPTGEDPVVEDEDLPKHDNYNPQYEESPQPDSEMKPESPKEKIDVLNDPLLPDDMDMRNSSSKKRGRGGSFGDGDHDNLDGSDEGIDLSDLDPEQRVAMVRELYMQYNEDPESFPDEQRIILEQEIEDLMKKGIIEGFDEEEEESEDERMKVKGEIDFPSNPLPFKDEEEEVENMNDAPALDVQEVDPRPDNIDFYHKEHEDQEQEDDQAISDKGKDFLKFALF